MANTNLKFYRGAAPTSPAAGMIWFDKANSTIKVYSGTAWESYAGKLIDATWDETKKALTLVKQDGSSKEISFADVASAASLTQEIADRGAGDTALGERIDNLVKVDSIGGESGVITVDGEGSGSYKVKLAMTGKELGATIEGLGTAAAKDIAFFEEAGAAAAVKSDLIGKDSDAITADTIYAAKKYADDKIAKSIASVYKVKGTKAKFADLPAEGNVEGDVWNVTEAHGNTPAGTNYVWVAAVGEVAAHWDALGGTIDLSPYAKSADVANTYAAKMELSTAKSDLLGVEGNAGATIYGAKKDVVDAKKTIDEYKVNGKKISVSPVLDGADMLVGGEGANKASKISAAIEDLYAKAGGVDGNVDAKITAAIEGLDSEVSNAAADSGDAASTQIKVKVSEVDGKLSAITVTAPSFESAGAAAAVEGKLNAFKDRSEGFATAAQGVLADNAVRIVAEGTANGTISVTTGTNAAKDIKVHGLGTAAYANTTTKVTDSSDIADASAVKAYVDNSIAMNNSILWASFE